MLMWSNYSSLLPFPFGFMKRMTKFLAIVGAATGLALASWAAAPGPADTAPSATKAPKPSDLFPDAVVAKGKGVEVKRSQLDDAMVSIKSTFASRGQDFPPDEMRRLEQQVLERLIQIQILLMKATDGDKAAGKDTCSNRMEAIRTRAGSEEMLNRQLKSVGTTQDQLKTKMTEESTAQIVLEREMKISVSEDEVKKFYNDNPSKFEQPEMVRASHILLVTVDPQTNKELSADEKAAKRKKAEDLLKRARAGEDFAKLAKENSEDPGSKDKGGEYQFARGQMVPEFEAAAFSLKPNEVSEIVTTQYGYHIIKLSEKIPAKKVELAKVSNELKDYLKQQQMQQRQQELQKYLEKIKKEASVEVLDEGLKTTDNAAAEPPRIIAPAAGQQNPPKK
jgi:peptidyl-prolyl cis-trans isomerase C